MKRPNEPGSCLTSARNAAQSGNSAVNGGIFRPSPMPGTELGGSIKFSGNDPRFYFKCESISS